MKRALDTVLALLGLLVSSPVLLLMMFLIWLGDWRSPLYVAPRVGRDFRKFHMIKLRSMRIHDGVGADSTSEEDPRITPIGRFVRRYKLDELIQLWNVIVGDISLVGPRPNVESEIALYTSEEQRLLSVKPGITDFSSIVFADEGEILRHHSDPDIAYNQLIRPWKSRLGLFYIEHQSLGLDLKLLWITLLSLTSRQRALETVANTLRELGAGESLVTVALRELDLGPMPPPGATEIVTSRDTKILRV